MSTLITYRYYTITVLITYRYCSITTVYVWLRFRTHSYPLLYSILDSYVIYSFFMFNVVYIDY